MFRRKKYQLFILFISSWYCLCLPQHSSADRILAEKIERFVKKTEAKNQKLKLSLMVTELGRNKSTLFAHKETQKMIPASVVKVLTSVAALKTLGGTYRFPTEVFVDALPSERDQRLNKTAGLVSDPPAWRAGNLYVRGYGDPTMVDERLSELARSIKHHGIKRLKNIVVDDTLFIDPPSATGERPYQAGLSATALNHNCYAVHVAPSGPGLKASVGISPGAPFKLQNRVQTRKGKKQSVFVSQSVVSSSYNPQQRFKKDGGFLVVPESLMNVDVKGIIGSSADKKTTYHTLPNSPAYYGSVLRYFLRQAGVIVEGDVLVGETPAGAKLLLTYESDRLSDIIEDLNLYSNNFIAGQIQYAMGQDSAGFFRRELGLERIKEVLLELGYAKESFALFDASGLDKRSRLTTEQLVRVLVSAYEDFSLAPRFVGSFSRYGHSGTLKKRDALSSEANAKALRSELPGLKQRASGVWGKTGTLTGVSSLAGYLELENGKRAAFAILVNGVSKNYATRIEDKIVEMLIGSPLEY